MQYEEALKVWGASRIQKAHPKAKIVPEAVDISLEMDYGCDCCNPSTGYLEISSGKFDVRISYYDFDFATILKEIVAAADGTITE